MTTMTTSKSPWKVDGDHVLDGDDKAIARAPVDVDTVDGDSRWRANAAAIAAVPLLVEACRGALHVLGRSCNDEAKDALEAALRAATGDADGVDLFTLSCRYQVARIHLKEAKEEAEQLRGEVKRLRAEIDESKKNYREIVRLRDRDNDRLVKHAVDVSRELASTRAELDALGVQYEAQRARLALAHVVVDAALAMHEALSRPVGGDPYADYEEQQARMRDLDAAVARWRAVPGDVLAGEPVAVSDRVAQLEHEINAARASVGEAWFFDGADLATAIKRKTAMLERLATADDVKQCGGGQ
jgi:hypothetical protein